MLPYIAHNMMVFTQSFKSVKPHLNCTISFYNNKTKFLIKSGNINTRKNHFTKSIYINYYFVQQYNAHSMMVFTQSFKSDNSHLNCTAAFYSDKTKF